MTVLTHPERVARAVPPGLRVVALLHDAIEDGHLTYTAAANALDDDAYEVLCLLTHEPGVPYRQYIRTMIGDRSPRNLDACTIKVANIQDNLFGRPDPPPTSLQRRYLAALETLQAALNPEHQETP